MQNLGSVFLSIIDSNVNRFKFYYLSSFVAPFINGINLHFKSNIETYQLVDWLNQFSTNVELL